MDLNMLESSIFDEQVPFQVTFESIFRYQLAYNPVYSTFAERFGYKENHVPANPEEAPLLPVEAFRQTRVCSTQMEPVLLFQSSGTEKMERSSHYVCNPDIYRTSILRGYDRHYPNDVILWAWMPGYSENQHSSLIWMTDRLLEYTPADGLSGYLTSSNISENFQLATSDSNKQIILFGAAFGLLDLLEYIQMKLPKNTIVIETGGMKTYRRDISREELHQRLGDGFSLPEEQIHSEYGMCELLSQAWSRDHGWFEPPPWMRVTIRKPDDPMQLCRSGEEGLIGVIDLANIYSCPFLLTGDRGISDAHGRFRVLGRYHPDDVRGCNFMIDSE